MESSVTGIKAAVNEYKFSQIDSKVILYILSVSKRDGQSWIIEKRYSEFDDLNVTLVKMFQSLPQLPGKTLFKLKEHADIEKRRIGMDYYLKVVNNLYQQQIVQRPDIFNSEALKQFLQLDKHASEQIVNPPKLLGEITGFIHGVRDYLYEKENVIFAITSDMNVASRVDAYLTNMKMPWEKEAPPTLLAVGCLECWVKVSDENDLKYDRVWNKTYPSQAICLYWDGTTSTLLIGLDDGKINLLKVLPENGFVRFDEMADIKVHQARVMGVFFDPISGTIHSVSEDKKYKVMDLSRQITIAEIQPSSLGHGLTGLVGDKDGRRIFVTDRGGQIHIYEMGQTSQPPNHCASVSSQTGSIIRGMFFDPIKNYLFTAGYDQGEIGIYDVGKSGREKFCKQTASLRGKAKMREIVWSTSRGEVMVGNEDGTVTIWSAKKATPIYVIKAHNTCITKLTWFEDRQMIVTSSKEKSIKFWQLPKEWRDKRLEQQEEQEYEALKKSENIAKSQQSMQKVVVISNGQREHDSDEDDLAGWHK